MHSVKKLTLVNPDFSRLSELHESVKSLHVLGSEPVKTKRLAVVGTRKPTPYGKAALEGVMKGLKGREVTVISGLALGIDALAHTLSLKIGLRTEAVLPCGIDTVYPRTNQMLAKKILSSGGSLLSEYEGSALPHKYTFIERNRIIAAMSDAVLIPEAAARSGSLHTAGFALELGIPVLAVPGPITSSMSRGTNELIRSGATPVLDSHDVLDVLNMPPEAIEQTVFDSNEEEAIVRALKEANALTTEQIGKAVGLEAGVLSHHLTLMEIKGSARCIYGTWTLV